MSKTYSVIGFADLFTAIGILGMLAQERMFLLSSALQMAAIRKRLENQKSMLDLFLTGNSTT